MSPKAKNAPNYASRPAPQEQKRRPQDHPPPRRRETYRRSIHMLNFTYEDDITIKNKHVAGISRTFYLSTETISGSPQSRQTISLNAFWPGWRIIIIKYCYR
jgi:hypothetical protein